MILDNRTTTTYLALLASCLVLSACGGGGEPTTPLTDGAVQHDGMVSTDGGQMTDGQGPDGPPPCTLDCNDNVDCTDDELNAVSCTCTHNLLHGLCLQQEPGTICCPDQGGCCTPMTICSTDEDCPDLDPQPNGSRGPCMQEYCEVATATCAWRQLDNDNDGHAPQVCVAIDGDDCDDTQWNINPDATENCDGSDNDCNGELDDLPELGLPCDRDSWDGGDEDLCEEGIWACDNADGWFDLYCTDNTNTTSEICDGLDNDCDGEIDEGVLNACGGCVPLVAVPGDPCDGPDSDSCEEGTIICNTNDETVCNDYSNDDEEVCNDYDDDCDGLIDEIWPLLNSPCDGSDTDFCEEGYYVCNTNGTNLNCTDTTGSTIEVCDGNDNNCDGDIDEGCDDDEDGYCDAEMIIVWCYGSNVPDCDDTDPEIHPYAAEICNGVDDDCDAETLGWCTSVIADNLVLLGGRVSLAIDTDDKPHIVYEAGVDDSATGNYFPHVFYGHREGTDWIIEDVGTGFDPDFVLDAGGVPHIISTWSGITYTTRQDNAWVTESFDYPDAVNPASIAIAPDGTIGIVYQALWYWGDTPYRHLRYGYKDNGMWLYYTIDYSSLGSYNLYYSFYSDIAIDSAGIAHVAYAKGNDYQGSRSYDPYYAIGSPGEFAISSLNDGTPYSFYDVGYDIQIKLDTAGGYHIVYVGRYPIAGGTIYPRVRYNNGDDALTAEDIASGELPSLAIAEDGSIYVAYAIAYDQIKPLHIARVDDWDQLASSWDTVVTQGTSIAVTPNGEIFVAYYSDDGSLRFVTQESL